ncbi:MAG TPA: 3'-5' exonuclease, partial [Chloroflexota bacterium]|nr:3'-5' exonuclease [Chloroflexota bacterium]
QAEIIWFLASDDRTANVQSWTDVRLEPGKLFVVGDPKQSIYRFRRADIGLYSRIYGQESSQNRAQLRENFRSVSAVLDWVNFQFRTDMVGDSGVQAPYVDLHTSNTDPDRGGVHPVGGLVDGGAPVAYEQEAAAIARCAQNAVVEEWLVRDSRSHDEWRPARYRDVCVLLRARTNVRGLEEAFERLSVPYRMESGSLVLDTQEVRDLLACLRAIDDPSDQVALVAALRSPAYACSDVDLLDWIDAGGNLNYLQSQESVPGFVGEGFCSLRAFHLARIDRSVATTVESFIRDRMLAVGVFDGRRPRETWRRLRYVVAQARALASAGRPTLRALVDWLESLQREQIRDVESPLPEADEDAVRVLTMHGAKGLEFPITILTGLNAVPRVISPGVQVLSNRQTGALEARVGVFQTGGYTEAKLREDVLEEAERTRVFYVAATRARDHLVLSLFHGNRGGATTAAKYLEGLTRPEAPRTSRLALEELPFQVSSPRIEPTGPVDTPDEQLADEANWRRERAVAIRAAGMSPAVTTSRLARLDVSESGREEPTIVGRSGAAESVLADLLDDDEREPLYLDPEAPPRSPYDQSIRIGRAVHSALAEIGPEGDRLIGPAVERAARENQLETEVDVVRRLVEASLRSPAIVGSRSLRQWREVTFGIDVDGMILAGRVDLVVETAESRLRVIDYKTEALAGQSLDERANRHRIQAGAYALAIQQSTGKAVEAVTLVFAAPGGGEVTWVDVDRLISDTRDLMRRREWLAGPLVDSPPSLQ